MDSHSLLADLRPVDVDGFSVSFGTHAGDILIKRGGRKHKHFFVSREPINNRRDYERVMRDAFFDFVKTARVGNGRREDYVRDYCWRMSKQDITSAWRVYRTAIKGMGKLLECDPTEFIEKYFLT